MKQQNVFTKTMVSGIAATMLVTSCASVPSAGRGQVLTPAQIEMRTRAKAYNRTVTEGMVGGAVAGALFGALIAGSGDRAKGAAIGALAGGLAGGLTGKYLAGKQKAYASKEAQLNSVIADLHLQNNEAESLIAALDMVVSEHKATLASLDAKYEEGLVGDADIRRQMAMVKQDQKQIQLALETAKDDQKLFSETRTALAKNDPDANFSELDREIARQKELYDAMAAVSGDLASVRGA